MSKLTDVLGSAIPGLVGVGGSLLNQGTAQNYGDRTKWQGTGMNIPGLGLNYANGTYNVTGNPLNQGYANTAGQLGNTLLSQQRNQVPMSFLQNEFGASNDPNANAYTTAGNQALGGLGSFDPNTLATNYTNQLRAQAAPQEQVAAQALMQQLMNSGRLGSSGGAAMAGQLGQAQGQNDISRLIAGMQLGGQEQSRLAGMATQLGGMGNQMTNARFQNAMNMFGASQQADSQNMQTGLQALGLGANINNQETANGLNAVAASGRVSAEQSAANTAAYNPQLMAGVAANNNLTGAIGDILSTPEVTDAIGSGLGSLLGGGGDAASGGLGSLLGGVGAAAGGSIAAGLGGAAGLGSALGLGGMGALGTASGAGLGIGSGGLGLGTGGLLGQSATAGSLFGSFGGLGAGEVPAAGAASGGGLAGGMAAAGPWAMAALAAYGAFKATKKEPARVGGSINSETGQAEVSFDQIDKYANSIGASLPDIQARLGPLLEQYAASDGSKAARTALMNSVPKPANFDKVAAVQNQQIALRRNPMAIGEALAKYGVDPTEYLLYDLVAGQNGLATGKNDILKAIDKQRAAGG